MNHFQKTNKKLEKLRSSFFLIGLIIAGGFTLLAFEWTFPEYISKLEGVPVEEIEGDFEYVEPFEIEKEIKEVKELAPPVVKSNEIKIVPDTEPTEKEKDPTKKVQPETKFNPDEWKTTPPVDPPTPPVFNAGTMPHYKDCKTLAEEERKICTQQKMYHHFNKTISIPESIKGRGAAEYLAFVYFEVNTKGEIANVKILNDKKHKIPKELEREAYNAVKSLPQLIPANNHGKKVAIKYKIPIKFTVR
jgi:outer membrane biosynthesis protein TonB